MFTRDSSICNAGLHGVMYVRFRPEPTRLAMPDVCCDLVWVGDKLYFAGPATLGQPISWPGEDIVLLNLDPLVARQWLGVPLTHLADRRIELRDIDAARAAPLEELFHAGGASTLVKSGAKCEARVAVVEAAAAMIRRGSTLEHTSSQVGLSERHLERLFADQFGLSPRLYGRACRKDSRLTALCARILKPVEPRGAESCVIHMNLLAIMALAVMGATSMAATDDAGVAGRNIEIVLGWNEAFERGDFEAATKYLGNDARNFGQPVGPDGYRRVWADIHATFPDWTTEILDAVASSDSVVLRSKVSATHLGTGRLPINGGLLVGVKPTGKRFEVLHIHWFKLRDGKIVDHYATRDDVGMMQQLGLLPTVSRPDAHHPPIAKP